jgi:hypothetical protein
VRIGIGDSQLAGCKGGAADPCPFWARGREAPDGGTRGDAPQYFRGRLPPPPIWPETRFEEACLSQTRELEEHLANCGRRGAQLVHQVQ